MTRVIFYRCVQEREPSCEWVKLKKQRALVGQGFLQVFVWYAFAFESHLDPTTERACPTP